MSPLECGEVEGMEVDTGICHSTAEMSRSDSGCVPCVRAPTGSCSTRIRTQLSVKTGFGQPHVPSKALNSIFPGLALLPTAAASTGVSLALPQLQRDVVLHKTALDME